MRYSLLLLGFALFTSIFYSCQTGVEPSPEPSLIRVTMQANPIDTMVVINQDTIYSDPRDSIDIKIFQGRVYKGSIFHFLYQNQEEFIQEDRTYNFFRRGNDGRFKEFTIFESILPPEKYNKLEFGIDAEYMLLTSGFFTGGISIPMETPPDSTTLNNFHVDVDMKEGRITEIKLMIDIFDSAVRHQDLFRFIPKIRVIEVKDAGVF